MTSSCRRSASVCAVLLAACVAGSCSRSESDARRSPTRVAPYTPDVKPASPEAARLAERFVLPEGFTAVVFAAEPLLANPVAIYPARGGRIYVAETFRQEDWGVPDNRNFRYWQGDDLAAQTVEDRRAMYLKHHPEYEEKWTREHERIRILFDDDGDGRADRSEVFADGFKDLLDGTGAGVLEHDGVVYYTCIPHLWWLRDDDGDGRADERRSLHYGYGVRVALRGHDMHGLAIGPDGRLYYSIGDRGYSVTTADGRHLADPGSGAVFRCNLDGSELEVFATGLRNPQELAFDDHGNLFTCDNNSDSEDKARVVYVVEGGDTGWRMNYQYLPRRGPWVREELWKPRAEAPGSAAFHIPPLANLGSGPSGLTRDPGTGFPERYRGAFFLADFLASRTHSSIRAFWLEPEGAGFRLAHDEKFVENVVPTDVDFGPDGALYVTDWGTGWVGEGIGRVYRIRPPESARTAAADDAARWLAGDFRALDAATLGPLLAHADRRVRLEAQLALAARGRDALDVFLGIARSTRAQLARLHAIWGLGQLERQGLHAIPRIIDLLEDGDAEVRAQVAKALGDARHAAARSSLVARLRDPSPRVQYFAALALGRLAAPDTVPDLVGLARANDERDVFLRHAAVMGLVGVGDHEALRALRSDPSVAVRLVAVLALRRLRDARVADFLEDAVPAVAVEAARAIYDHPIEAAWPALAARLGRAGCVGEPFVRRAIAARDRLGRPEDARALLAFAGTEAPAKVRAFALELLARWDDPPALEPIHKFHRPRPAGSVGDLGDDLARDLTSLLADEADGVRSAAARLAGHFEVASVAPRLGELARDARTSTALRLDALDALRAIAWPRLETLVATTVRDPDSAVRARSAEILAALDPATALPILSRVLEDGEVRERQLALDTLARMKDLRADLILLGLMDRLDAGDMPPELVLELIDATRRRGRAGIAELAERVQRHDRRIAVDPEPLAPWLPSLVGGDAERGKEAFAQSAASCGRCHALAGDQRTEMAGPALSAVGSRRTRREILESIVLPNAHIAEGFQSAIVETKDGHVFDGLVLEETAAALTLEYDQDGRRAAQTVAKPDIVFRRESRSAMPEDLRDKLDARELRDLVEFLSRQRAAGD